MMGIVVGILGIYGKTFLVIESTLIKCHDYNITQCKIISKSKDTKEMYPRKSFSVEDPSTNVT